MNRLRAIFLLAASVLMLTLTPAMAADQKTVLHDSLTVDQFVTNYNQISGHKIVDYGNKKSAGENTVCFGVIDENNVAIMTEPPDGRLLNIILLHRGAIGEAEKAMLKDVFFSVNQALGFTKNDDTAEARLKAAFDLLALDKQDFSPSRLSRADIGRDYFYVKDYKADKDVYSIVIEAIKN